MNRTFTCIICPLGCEIETTIEEQEILEMSGANCPRGRSYVENEIKNPLRMVTTSVRVIGGTLPVTSVRLTSPIPRARMTDVITALREIQVAAPAVIGQVIIKDILGLGCDVIITKNVARIDPVSPPPT